MPDKKPSKSGQHLKDDAAAFGRALTGMTVNLLVSDMARAQLFTTQVLGASFRYKDDEFAIVKHGDLQWLLHSDRTYAKHQFLAVAKQATEQQVPRGAGIELHLHRKDLDQAIVAAETHGFNVFDGPRDQAHGLRELYIMDDDGYMWVLDSPLPAEI